MDKMQLRGGNFDIIHPIDWKHDSPQNIFTHIKSLRLPRFSEINFLDRAKSEKTRTFKGLIALEVIYLCGVEGYRYPPYLISCLGVGLIYAITSIEKDAPTYSTIYNYYIQGIKELKALYEATQGPDGYVELTDWYKLIS